MELRSKKRYREISPCSSSNRSEKKRITTSLKKSNPKRTHIERPRFHMAQLGVKIKRSICDEVQKLLGDYIPDPVFKACHANRDAFIKLLLSACDGTDNTMGSPDMPEILWKNFTKRWIQDLKLDIVITEETVATCEKFGSSLKDLHLGMEKTSRQIEKHRREQLIQPLELKQSLFKVFGKRKPRFRRKESTGSSSKSTSGRSKKSSDASVTYNPYLDPRLRPIPDSLKAELMNAYKQLENDGVMTFEDIGKVEAVVSVCEMSVMVFLNKSQNDKRDVVQKILS